MNGVGQRRRARASLPFRLAHHDPFPGSIVIPRYVVRKLESRVVRTGENECWTYEPHRPFRLAGRPDFKPNPDRHHQIGWRDPETNVRLTIPTQRLALIVENGPIPPELLACHLCAGEGSQRCCNPKHLYAGTAAMQAEDRVLKRAIQAAQGPGSLEGLVLPRHPRSAPVCEALINGQDVAPIIEREQALAPPSVSLSIGSFHRGGSMPPPPSPRIRLRPARGQPTIR